ncbi:endothelial cell-specific chemotaxis regulator isoform X2 [Labeo rohita]|uniref:endothelial cell-specific chemotaxis regulator isoform X2 n=1 Tax=Labeo rohita TaxID=84645 RepID=UPI0021E1F2C9|nr:endothelial cell-specific chemotaxis regulator isoform X2 [Labeo rohita]
MERLFFLLTALFASSSIISAGNDTNVPTTVLPNTTATSPWSIDSTTEVQTEKTVPFASKSEDDMTNHTSNTVNTTFAPVSSNYTSSTVGLGLSLHSTSEQSIITSSTLTTTKSYTNTALNSSSSPAAKITGITDGSGLSSDNTSVGVFVLPTTVNSNISMSEVTATPSQAPDSGLTLLAFGVMSLILILIVVMVVLVTAINLRGRCRNSKQHEGMKSRDSVLSDSNMTSTCEKESITLVSVRTINTENNFTYLLCRYRFSPDVFGSQHYSGQ